MTFGLLDITNLNVSPHNHRDHAKSPDSRTHDQHDPLRIAVGMLNRDTSRRANRIRQLHRDVFIDGGQIREFGRRKVFR